MATVTPVDYDPFAAPAAAPAPQGGGQRYTPSRPTFDVGAPASAPATPAPQAGPQFSPVDYNPFEVSKAAAVNMLVPGGFNAAFQSFDQFQPAPDVQQRFSDIGQIGKRYDVADPSTIREIDRRAQGVADSGVSNAAAQGATFGFSDEGKALLSALTGGSYNTTVAGEREGMRRFSRDNPVTAAASEIGGALLTAPFLPTAVAARGAALGTRMLASGATGAGYGALYGAGTGEGVGRIENSAMGALGGGVSGGALPAAGSALSALGRGVNAVAGNPAAIVRGLVNPESEAARRVGVALSRDAPGVSPNQAVANAGDAVRANGAPFVVADAGGEATRALARSSANTSPEGREVLTRATQNRFETQNVRVTDTISRIMGGRGNNVERVDALREAARKANRPLYEKAYREGQGGLWNQELFDLTQSPMVQNAIRLAETSGKDRAVAEGYRPVRNPFVTDADGNLTLAVDAQGNRALPTLEFWDVVKRKLDDTVGAALKSGESSTAETARAIRKKLLETLDAASPTYAKARASAASFFGAEDALEAGEKFVMSSRRNDEARKAIMRMSSAERELFAEGFATGLVNRVGEVRDRVNVINQIFGTPASRERIEMALGKTRAAELETFVRRENVMDMLRTALGNSTTARQLVEIGLAGGAGLYAGGGDVTSPSAIMTGLAVFGAQKGLGAVDRNVAKRVADLLVIDDPEKLRRAMQAITDSTKMSTALRTVEGNLAKLAAPSGANGDVAPILLTPGRTEQD